MAFPDRGRDDFSDRRFGISDRFGQKVFGDGCDNSLRALDYIFGLRHGLVFAYFREEFFSLV